MKIFLSNLLPLLILILTNCGSDSNEIEMLSKPQTEFYKQFEFTPKGQITYQFYHEYGFTDKVWHLISIVQPEVPPNLENKLPLESIHLKRLSKIDIRKFIKGKPIIFKGDYVINSDITLTAQEYHLLGSHLNINHENGSYSIDMDGDTEILRIYDSDKGLEYIELKKW